MSSMDNMNNNHPQIAGFINNLQPTVTQMNPSNINFCNGANGSNFPMSNSTPYNYAPDNYNDHNYQQSASSNSSTPQNIPQPTQFTSPFNSFNITFNSPPPTFSFEFKVTITPVSFSPTNN
ncbi:hypothetical protein C1645_830113 [Glomus cerebriforme]|uniref:Uncharacterized protein n=1 Tax=Glomus cerebriforme TaxID=658196 RepID=A0A397ST82_9GLOM|nr:hypothetical protein C1645_830113 [Glomus cerebriforme]